VGKEAKQRDVRIWRWVGREKELFPSLVGFIYFYLCPSSLRGMFAKRVPYKNLVFLKLRHFLVIHFRQRETWFSFVRERTSVSSVSSFSFIQAEAGIPWQPHFEYLLDFD
jgi:hypothetical protein